MPLRRYSPLELAVEHNATRASLSPSQFFSPQNQKARERYCAAVFSASYAGAIAPCIVAIEQPDPQNDVDFYLEVGGVTHPFQLIEAQEPNRRRGDQYKHKATDKVQQLDAELAHERGPEWIRSTIQKKLERYAGQVESLHLLVYVNFPVFDLEFERVREVASGETSSFRSVWLVTGNATCCLRSCLELGSLEGWYRSPIVTDEA